MWKQKRKKQQKHKDQKLKLKEVDPEMVLDMPQVCKKLIEAFDVFDNAKNQQIDVRELGTIIRAVGCVITEAELQEIQVELEDVENNCVTQDRFVEYMSKAISEQRFKPAEAEDILKSFQVLDPEGRGYILKSDLIKSLMEVGEQFTQQEINEMMIYACEPNSDKIHYEDYINLLIVPDNRNIYLTFKTLSVKFGQ